MIFSGIDSEYCFLHRLKTCWADCYHWRDCFEKGQHCRWRCPLNVREFGLGIRGNFDSWIFKTWDLRIRLLEDSLCCTDWRSVCILIPVFTSWAFGFHLRTFLKVDFLSCNGWFLIISNRNWRLERRFRWILTIKLWNFPNLWCSFWNGSAFANLFGSFWADHLVSKTVLRMVFWIHLKFLKGLHSVESLFHFSKIHF